jgi:putative Mn2+ efflux pump MntP
MASEEEDESYSLLKQHVDALLLAIASSTDNFTVGVTIGVCGKRLPLWVNGFISGCNASGAMMAAYGGALASQHMPLLAPLLAAFAFGYLSWSEMVNYYSGRTKRQPSKRKDDDENENHRHEQQQPIGHQPLHLASVLRLALPMTLNNLAGGVAGGAAGLSPRMASAYALLASFGMMALGHSVGIRMGRNLSYDPSLIAGILLAVLCLLTVNEAIGVSLK